MFTYSIKRACEIRKFHVPGVQPRQRNEQNGMMHVQICCFVNKKLLLFMPFSFRRRCRWFCCHPEIVLPWWRVVTLLLSINYFFSTSTPGSSRFPILENEKTLGTRLKRSNESADSRKKFMLGVLPRGARQTCFVARFSCFAASDVNSVFAQLAKTWFVVRQFWTFVVNRAT